MNEKLVRIVAPHFIAGVIIEQKITPLNGIQLRACQWTIKQTAPILQWAIRNNWTWDNLYSYCRVKKWKVEML